MLKKRLSGLVACMCVLGLAATAWAGIPDLDLSTAVTAAGAQVSVMNCPLGDGDPLTSARTFGVGNGTDATITLTLLDGNTDPIPGYLKEDLWLDANGIVFCPDGTIADADTDVNGQTTWTVGLKAGGCSDDVSVNVWVNGETLTQAPINMLMNSPDMNSDLTVHISRYPQGEWVALDAESHYSELGRGVAAGSLWDEKAWLGRSAQTLFLDHA